jgi:hypothetical protein
MAVRTRLYAVDGRGADNRHPIRDVSACLRSSLTLALLRELDPVYQAANACLDSAAASAIIGGNVYLLWTPDLRAFRQDPRFSAFAARLGLTEYWQRFGPPDECSLKDGTLACD